MDVGKIILTHFNYPHFKQQEHSSRYYKMKSTLAGWHRFPCTPAMTFSLSSKAPSFKMPYSGTNATV